MPFSQRHTSVLFALLLVFALATGTGAAHIPHGKSRLAHRDTPYNGPTSFQTTQSIVTAGGAVIETCNITLTPVVGPDGEALVREEKTCTLSTPAATGIPDATPAPAPPAAATTTVQVTTLTTSLTISASNVVSTTQATTTRPEPSGTPAPEAPQETTPTGPIALGTSLTSASGVTAPLAAQSVSATAAAESVAPTSTELDLPGKSLSVLPIGLGIFAGISVIALVVIGLVTYERTKHRRAFRERKLAEAGAGMGHGGGYGATA